MYGITGERAKEEDPEKKKKREEKVSVVNHFMNPGNMQFTQ